MLRLALLLLLAEPPLLNQAEVNRVVQGEVIARSQPSVTADGKTAGFGIGAIVVDRSLADTWKVLANYTDKAEYQPRVKKCTILERTGDTLRVAMEVDAGLITATYTGLYTLDAAAHTVHWRLDRQAPGNSIADMDGGYTLIPAGPLKTVIYLKSYVDSGHLLPRFIQNHFSVNAIPDLLRAIKARVESDGKYRK